MTTKELIEKLQELDPDGSKEVYLADGSYMDCPVEDVWLTAEKTMIELGVK